MNRFIKLTLASTEPGAWISYVYVRIGDITSIHRNIDSQQTVVGAVALWYVTELPEKILEMIGSEVLACQGAVKA